MAWDLETAEWGEDGPLDPTAGLGVTCLVAVETGTPPHLFYDMEQGFRPAPRVGNNTLRSISRFFTEMQIKGYTALTWNGANFDYQLLGHETGQRAFYRKLALEHVDLMLLFAAIRRHRLSLRAAAQAVGAHKGADGIADGLEAATMWRTNHKAVLRYCIQDCTATLAIATHLLTHGGFTWISRRGYAQQFTLPKDLRDPRRWTVRHLLYNYEWPKPDGWITDPCQPEDWDWLMF